MYMCQRSMCARPLVGSVPRCRKRAANGGATERPSVAHFTCLTRSGQRGRRARALAHSKGYQPANGWTQLTGHTRSPRPNCARRPNCCAWLQRKQPAKAANEQPRGHREATRSQRIAVIVLVARKLNPFLSLSPSLASPVPLERPGVCLLAQPFDSISTETFVMDSAAANRPTDLQLSDWRKPAAVQVHVCLPRLCPIGSWKPVHRAPAGRPSRLHHCVQLANCQSG